MHRIFTLALVMFFTIAIQGQLKAIYSIDKTKTEVVQHPSAEIESSVSEVLPISLQRTGKRAGKSKFNKALSKVAKGLSKVVPKRMREPGSGLAIASLILGILGILTVPYVVLAILALIFGLVSMKRYKEGYHDRRGMAKAGIILGIIGLSLALLLYGLVILSFFLF